MSALYHSLPVRAEHQTLERARIPVCTPVANAAGPTGGKVRHFASEPAGFLGSPVELDKKPRV